MPVLFSTTLTLLATVSGRVRQALTTPADDEGASTLELVIIILGLVTVAGILVTALTAAVSSRVAQIQ